MGNGPEIELDGDSILEPDTAELAAALMEVFAIGNRLEISLYSTIR
jgi:hypothetical protein